MHLIWARVDLSIQLAFSCWQFVIRDRNFDFFFHPCSSLLNCLSIGINRHRSIGMFCGLAMLHLQIGGGTSTLNDLFLGSSKMYIAPDFISRLSFLSAFTVVTGDPILPINYFNISPRIATSKCSTCRLLRAKEGGIHQKYSINCHNIHPFDIHS